MAMNVRSDIAILTGQAPASTSAPQPSSSEKAATSSLQISLFIPEPKQCPAQKIVPCALRLPPPEFPLADLGLREITITAVAPASPPNADEDGDSR
ncbi:hypothetical protein B2J93_2860 [Marssonina coronariae]|uniref:Uncharacterized protein n=1 Tax=Diplocarpon coronariae TaxID=2795749 RepID=A0A218YSG5_9HELO|nr:hypothetical protein B2J93_2860 [Marssonina coronariae]